MPLIEQLKLRTMEILPNSYVTFGLFTGARRRRAYATMVATFGRAACDSLGKRDDAITCRVTSRVSHTSLLGQQTLALTCGNPA